MADRLRTERGIERELADGQHVRASAGDGGVVALSVLEPAAVVA